MLHKPESVEYQFYPAFRAASKCFGTLNSLSPRPVRDQFD